MKNSVLAIIFFTLVIPFFLLANSFEEENICCVRGVSDVRRDLRIFLYEEIIQEGKYKPKHKMFLYHKGRAEAFFEAITLLEQLEDCPDGS